MSLTTKIIIVVFLAVAAFVVFKLWQNNTITSPVGTYVPATKAPEVKLIPKVTVHPKVVKVYAHVAVAHLKLPDDMKNQEVLDATEVKSDTRPQTIVTTLNPDTGEVTTVVRRDPYKWVQAEQVGGVEISYGYRGTDRIARMTASEDLVQVKGVNLGVVASLDSDGQHFVGAAISYRW